MITMTWREVKAALAELSEDQLDMSATILDGNTKETYGITDCFILSELPESYIDELDGVLDDENQPLLVINGLDNDNDNDEDLDHETN